MVENTMWSSSCEYVPAIDFPSPLRGETVEIASTGFTRGYNRTLLRGVQAPAGAHTFSVRDGSLPSTRRRTKSRPLTSYKRKMRAAPTRLIHASHPRVSLSLVPVHEGRASKAFMRGVGMDGPVVFSRNATGDETEGYALTGIRSRVAQRLVRDTRAQKHLHARGIR